METIKTVWNVFVLLFGVAFFGGLTKVTYELGMSAVNLHQKGMVSLGKFNRMLVGETPELDPPRGIPKRSR